MKNTIQHLDTQLIHAGEIHPRFAGAVNLPVFQSSTFESADIEGYHNLRYIRLNNTPNHQALGAKLAAIEHAEAAFVAGSGMAAITCVLLSLLRQGDHILIQGDLYGGTFDFITKDLPHYGITYSIIDIRDPDSWPSMLQPRTKAIYVESISNPLVYVPDLEKAPQFARDNNLVSIIDNTFATPVNFIPADVGFDISLHSCTKYINGHSDIVAGAVIGKKNLVEQALIRLNHLGGALDPHACYLLHRGMKTLGLRVRTQNSNAQQLAEMLEQHLAVDKVYYPGLESSNSYNNARKYLKGNSGMLSFELQGGAPEVDRFFAALTVPIIAPSLGGVETLVTLPARTSHAGMTPEERQAIGVTDTLIRVSVGIEAAPDLMADFSHALDAVQA